MKVEVYLFQAINMLFLTEVLLLDSIFLPCLLQVQAG